MYSKDKILVFLSDTFCYEISYILSQLYLQKFTNVLYLDMNTFHKTKTFISFQVFPTYMITFNTVFKKEIITNVQGSWLKLGCCNQFPFSICSLENNKAKGSGRTFYLLENFVKFLNASLELRYEPSERPAALMRNHDLWTRLTVIPHKVNVSREL